MLDINLLLEERGGNPDLVRESEKRRGGKVELVDQIIAEYKEWTTFQFTSDQKNKEANAIQKEIGKKFKAKEDPSELVAQKNALQQEKEALVAQAKEKETSWKNKLNLLGNIVHSSVPTSMDEDNNEVIRTYYHNGVEPVKRTDIMSHHEVLSRLDGYDQDRGAKIAGHRGYFLTGVGVDLNLALITYGLNFLARYGYKKLQTPFFMNKDMMAKTAQLSQFDEELYKVSGDGEDKYLIATSEQPISAFHSGEWFEKPSEQLPIKYAGYSTCFRKEAGAHGKDTWGIFRVHQFEKIEQFVLSAPENSWEMFNEMIEHSEEFFKSLGLSYRVVAIVSGALNNAAAKKYDLEAWFPSKANTRSSSLAPTVPTINPVIWRSVVVSRRCLTARRSTSTVSTLLSVPLKELFVVCWRTGNVRMVWRFLLLWFLTWTVRLSFLIPSLDPPPRNKRKALLFLSI
ncbi:hypothetical protein V8B55DRAFT_1174352 [Mucor lusitanicus]